jgi:hypothetical protein
VPPTAKLVGVGEPVLGMLRRRIPIGADVLWVAAALAWGAASWLIVHEYRKLGGEARQLQELSLLWAQFGFAALFADWRRNRGRRFRVLLLRTLLPPLVLHFVIFGLL